VVFGWISEAMPFALFHVSAVGGRDLEDEGFDSPGQAALFSTKLIFWRIFIPPLVAFLILFVLFSCLTVVYFYDIICL